MAISKERAVGADSHAGPASQGDTGARAAQELRDTIAPRLADLAIELGDIRARVTSHPLEAERRLASTVREVIGLTDGIQTLSRALDPSAVLHVGLDESLRHEATLFAEREGVPVRYRGAHDLPEVAADVILTFFRVAQAALHYVTRDGQATTVDVDLESADQQLYLTVRSDASGSIEPDGHDPTAVAAMKRWMAAVGGQLAASGRETEGTSVEASARLPG